MSPGMIKITKVVDGHDASTWVDDREDVGRDEEHIRGIKKHLQGEAEVGPKAREGHDLNLAPGRRRK
jgi:hypothetical protein